MSAPSLLLTVNVASDVPVYRQIVDGLRACLVSGQVKPDDHLPTVRELAGALNVHFNTVAEAYRILADEGWLELKRRRGVRVLPRTVPAVDPARRADLSQRLRELIAALRSEGITKEEIRKQVDITLQGVPE